MKIMMLAGWALLFAMANGAQAEGIESLLPETLVDSRDKAVQRDTLQGKLIGLYFSAEWCPPCRAFSPSLVKFRDQNSEDFDVVFVSSDRTKKEQLAYMRKYKMRWLAVPHDSPSRAALGKKFGVRGIPALIIIDSDGNIISRNGRQDVAENKNALEDWKKKAAEFEQKQDKT